ncbi:MAG: bifunctional D-glycero-beta-D-manno-heptose-7-phosphate kinase/D-glycero-beta-D-manno-heptose 1-phosphate adenylyltransferase HldE [Pseudomonadota bacterium]
MQLSIPDFSGARVVVVGDVMLDRYWRGETQRISPEAPVPVVRMSGEEDRPGGAANVALNLAALGLSPVLVGLIGDDEAGEAMTTALRSAGVDGRMVRASGHPTSTKLRVLSRNQQLIRLDFEDEPPADGEATVEFERLVAEVLEEGDVVVFSDYAKGTLRRVATYIQWARDRNCRILVDPKGDAFEQYAGATVLTPNLPELERVVGACPDEESLVRKSGRLLERLGLEALLVTRGGAGMSLIESGGRETHLPARAREVFDVTGAGDTVIALLAAGLAAGEDLAHAMSLANAAAGIVVGKLGTATVSVPELRAVAVGEREQELGVVSEEQLMLSVAHARERGERLVMTNGCFDLLHAGHVQYLEEAAALGDRLIVAVNDDASVTALKGAGRPLNRLERRMAVLAGLRAVDWVVPFSEETPERLICRVEPDCLVKGGDYRPETIAGHDCVAAAGGETRVLGFAEGISTSGMVEQIRSNHGD